METKVPKISTRMMVTIAMLIALEIVLTRICSINTTYMRIGFGFVPIAVCAIGYGPIWAAVAYGIGDIIGATLFPSGAFFPGFTLSAVLTGLTFGFFLNKKYVKFPMVVAVLIAVLINCLIISLCVNTYWLTIMYGKGTLALMPVRIVQNLINIPVQFAVILGIMKSPINSRLLKGDV